MKPGSSSATVKNRLIAFSAFVSLLVCLLMGGLWVRSLWSADFLSYTANHRSAPGFSVYSLDSIHGSIHFGGMTTPSELPSEYKEGFKLERHKAADVRVAGDYLGFGYVARVATGSSAAFWELWMPNWFLILALALPAIPWLFSRYRLSIRQRRLARGQCADCGYDLHATPDRCPECGVEPTKHLEL